MNDQEIIDKMSRLAAFGDEVQLLGYGESDTGGPWIKMRLKDPDQLTVFRGKPKAAAGKLGQRYHCILIEIGDDELPVKQEPTPKEKEELLKGGPLSKRAAFLCQDPLFWRFMERVGMTQHDPLSTIDREDQCVNALRYRLNIMSRIDLDHDQAAAARFKDLLGQFTRWGQGQQGLAR